MNDSVTRLAGISAALLCVGSVSGQCPDTDGNEIVNVNDVLGCSFTVDSEWSMGFTATLLINNNTGESITGWQLEFDVIYQLTGLWPVDGSLWVQDADGHVVVQNESWNAAIMDGASLEIGFQAEASPVAPTSVVLNGIEVDVLP